MVRRPHLILAAVLSGLLLLNIVEFPVIEDTRNSRWQAINNSPTDDLLDLAMSQSGNVRGWYSVHIEIGQTSPGADIVLPRGASYSRDRLVASLYGYGKAESVVQARYSFEFTDIDSLLNEQGRQLLTEPRDDSRVSSGPGRTGFTDWLLVLEQPAPRSGRSLVAFELTLGETEYLAFIEMGLLADGLREEIENA